MRPKNKERIIPARLQALRDEKGLTQAELTKDFNKCYPDKQIGYSSFSMWETGRRPVTKGCLEPIMEYFGVSKSYLFGLTDDKNEEFEDDVIEEMLNKQVTSNTINDINLKSEILWKDLFRFDKCPIYVEFPNFDAMGGWAIYNKATNEFVFADKRMPITDAMKKTRSARLYSTRLDYLASYGENIRKPLELIKVMNMNQVYVKMASPDSAIRAMYNGWYHHNEKHTALINSEGLVLPYNGLGVSYSAYSVGDNYSYY